MDDIKPKTPVPGGAEKIKDIYNKHKKRKASKELIDGLRQEPSEIQEVSTDEPDESQKVALPKESTI